MTLEERVQARKNIKASEKVEAQEKQDAEDKAFAERVLKIVRPELEKLQAVFERQRVYPATLPVKWYGKNNT